MASSEELSKEIKRILKTNTSLQYDESVNKVKCSLSGHEMPCKVEQIQMYLNGKKFKKLKAKQDEIFEKYKPHIVPNTNKGFEHQLFCMLTKKSINRSVEHVERHINGANFKKALKDWNDNKTTEDNKDTAEEACVIEEEEEKEEEDQSEDQEDLKDLYPDLPEDDVNYDNDDEDDDDDGDEERHLKKSKPSTSKRKADFKDAGGKRKKQKKKKKPK